MFGCVKSLIFLSVNMVVLSEVATVNSDYDSFLFGTKSLLFKKIAAAILVGHFCMYWKKGIKAFHITVLFSLLIKRFTRGGNDEWV